VRGTRNLDRDYDKLTSSERFSLFVAARARGDDSETERLLQSCPERTYRTRDPGFRDRLECAFALTTALIRTLGEIEGKLDVVAAAELAARTLFTIAADNVEFEASYVTDAVPTNLRRIVRRECGQFRRIFRGIRGTLLAEGATFAHSFAEVCRDELGVDPHQLVTAAAPQYVDLFEDFIALAPDEEQHESVRAAMVDAWRSWTQKHSEAGGRGKTP
jgi:hypothetical protein